MAKSDSATGHGFRFRVVRQAIVVFMISLMMCHRATCVRFHEKIILWQWQRLEPISLNCIKDSARWIFANAQPMPWIRASESCQLDQLEQLEQLDVEGPTEAGWIWCSRGKVQKPNVAV